MRALAIPRARSDRPVALSEDPPHPNGDPAQPHEAKTALTGAIPIPPFTPGEKFFQVPGKPSLRIFQVLPVTVAEMDFKVAKGCDALLERLEAKLGDPVYGPLEPTRPSAC